MEVIHISKTIKCDRIEDHGELKMTINYCLFCFLFLWGFSFHSRIFYSYGDVTITGEGLQILTYTVDSLLFVGDLCSWICGSPVPTN